MDPIIKMHVIEGRVGRRLDTLYYDFDYFTHLVFFSFYIRSDSNLPFHAPIVLTHTCTVHAAATYMRCALPQG